MIIRVVAENFKSFEERSELCFLASGEILDHADHVVRSAGVDVLRLGAIYGANAAGKSNILDLFSFIYETIEGGVIRKKYENCFCRTKGENELRESSFEVQFTCGERAFSYGFVAILSKLEIKEEWLYELVADGDGHKLIYERKSGGIIMKGDDLFLSDIEEGKLKTYIDDFAGDTKRVFIKEINTNKKIGKDSELWIVREVYQTIVEDIKINNVPDIRPLTLEMSMEAVSDLISTFDTGVTKVQWRDCELDELRQAFPEGLVIRALKQLEDDSMEGRKATVVFRSRNDLVLLSVHHDMVKCRTLLLKHGDSPYDFSFKDESDGTRRIFELLGILLNNDDRKIFIIDELDRSLHPMLTKMFVKLFVRLNPRKSSQLIFTTHEPSLMDEKLLRHDEIWFVERDKNNVSKLYSLDGFALDPKRNISLDYLDGRYGAIPCLKNYK